ncbi:MAG: DUF790 family protein [Conexivisphaera sp.]
MLSVDLLRVRVRKGVARPAYLTPDDAAAVREVLGAFSSAVAGSWKYAELEERISQISRIYDRRLVRGLSSLMERRLTLSQASGIPPVELRRLLFSMGPVISREERDALIASVASKFNTSVDEVERAIFSDVEREKVVAGLEALGPGDLIAWYNAELTETLLARSVSLRISAARLWSAILRRIKRLGLMYEVIEGEGAPSIEVTGPASVLGIHDRYSRAASGLVPVLLDVGEWRMEGRIRLGTREMEFSVDSSSAEMRYPPDVIGRSIRTFDSSIEERLYRALLQAAPDLRVSREPAPLDAGPGVMVPDFAVDVDGHRVFIEVVGFWTPEYLRRKVEKLRRVRGVDMILLVDGSIGFPRADVPSEVIFYHGNDIPLKRLLTSIRVRSGRDTGFTAAVQSPGRSGSPIAGLDALLEELVGSTFDEVEHRLRPILGENWLGAIESMGYYFEWGSLDVRDARLSRRG